MPRAAAWDTTHSGWRRRVPHEQEPGMRPLTPAWWPGGRTTQSALRRRPASTSSTAWSTYALHSALHSALYISSTAWSTCMGRHAILERSVVMESKLKP